MKLSQLVVTATALLTACGGVEEIALNPQGAAAGSTAAGNTATSGSGGTLSMSPAGGAGSNDPAASGSGGVTSAGGMPTSTEHAGSAGQPPMMPAQGGTSAVGCMNDAACLSDATPHCRADGQCVACLVDIDCSGDDPLCDVVSGSCTNVDCPAGGNDAGGNCP